MEALRFFPSIFHTIQWAFYTCFILLSISHAIQWKLCILFSFFINFDIIQWEFFIFSLLVNFPCFLIGILHFLHLFVNFPWCSRVNWCSQTQSGRSPPVFYRTSFPSVPLPYFPSPTFTNIQSRATGFADHILPLGDWLCIGWQVQIFFAQPVTQHPSNSSINFFFQQVFN